MPKSNQTSVELIHGDCLDVLPTLACPDVVITDIPYGTTACKWDSVIPLDDMWLALDHIHHKAPVILFGAQPFTSKLITSNIENFKYCWVWRKSKGSNFPHAPNMPLKITEDVAVFSTKKIGHVSQLGDKRMPYFPQGTTAGRTVVKQSQNTSELKYHRDSQTNHTTGYKCKRENYPNTILDIKSASKTVHPTQKPVALMEYLIKTYTNEGDTVLDFCMGSGTTGIACLNTGRNFIGIEKDEEYFNIAQERISNHG